MQDLAGESVHSDARLLADTYIGHLRFLVVGDDPYIRQRHERDHLRADAEILAGAHQAFTHHTVDRGDYLRVAQIDRRQSLCSPLSLQRRGGLCLLALQDIKLLTLLIQLGLVQGKTRGRAFFVVDSLFDELRCAGVFIRKQSLLADGFQMIASHVCLARRDFGLGLFDQGFLQALLLFDIVDRSSSGSDIGLSLIELGAVVVVDDLDQDIASTNALEVLHPHVLDVAGNFGSEGCRISLKISIVGFLQYGRSHPPIPFASDDENQGTDQNENKDPDCSRDPNGGKDPAGGAGPCSWLSRRGGTVPNLFVGRRIHVRSYLLIQPLTHRRPPAEQTGGLTRFGGTLILSPIRNYSEKRRELGETARQAGQADKPVQAPRVKFTSSLALPAAISNASSETSKVNISSSVFSAMSVMALILLCGFDVVSDCYRRARLSYRLSPTLNPT